MRRMKKRAIAALLTCAMAVSLTACGSGSSNTAATVSGTSSGETSAQASADEKGKLSVGLYGGLDSLNPWTSGRITKDMVTYTLYETLASCQSGSADLENILMKEYERVDDVTFDVTLYDNIKDVAGNPITASDVVFSFNQYNKNWATVVEEALVKDEYTVELKLNTAAAGAFEYIVCKVPIASEKSYNESPDQFATTSCGTMPYTVAEYVAGNSIVLKKTDTYWQTEDLTYPGSTSNADTIEFVILEEATQLALAIEKGDIQVAMFIQPSMLDEVSSKENLEIYGVPSSEDRGIMFCMTEDSPFYNNLELRQAVLYAIDNESVAEACGYGYAEPSIVTCGSKQLTIGYDSSWETSPYSYNPEKAKELLTQAGYGDGGLHLRLLANNNGTITTMWQIIQANLMAVGIDAELNVCEGTTYGSYRDGTSGQYEMAYAGPGNSGYATQDLWNTLFNRKNYDSGRTWAGLLDDKLQSLYDTLATADGYTQENVNAFYDYITDNAYYYEIYSMPDYAAYNTAKIKGFYTDWNRFIRVNTIELAD